MANNLLSSLGNIELGGGNDLFNTMQSQSLVDKPQTINNSNNNTGESSRDEDRILKRFYFILRLIIFFADDDDGV